MTVAVVRATEPVATNSASLALADEFWPEHPETWREERDAYLSSVASIGDEADTTANLSNDRYAAHAAKQRGRVRRRSMTERAASRRVQTVEQLLSDRKHFGDRDERWRNRSRVLAARGRSVRSVLGRTWADGYDRHCMVCGGWSAEGPHKCTPLVPLMLGGEWRRYTDLPNRWYHETTSRGTLRNAALNEYQRDDLQAANEAFGLQLLHPMALLIFAQLVAEFYWPRCNECGVLVGCGEERRHQYGHRRSHFGYSEWLAARANCYTTQSFNWPVVWPALKAPMHRWLARRDWSTHVRRITISGTTMWWQPRPNMNRNRSTHKEPFKVKPGNGNYTVFNYPSF